MGGLESAKRRRVLYPLLAGSWAVFALASGGCVDNAKKIRGQGGSSSKAGESGQVAGSAGLGGNGGSMIEEAAGASGASEAPGGAGGEGGASDGGEGGEGGTPTGISGGGGDTNNTQGGTGGTGTGGSGGFEIDTFNEPCPVNALDGWASMAGPDFDPQATGLSWQEVTVTSDADLIAYAASADPYIIHLSGTIKVAALAVKSNKVIVGADRDATLEGGILIAGTTTAAADMVSNVAIRNLHIDAQSTEATVGGDFAGIGVAYAHHVWVDHVDFFQSPADGIDITHGSDHVTVSWSRFRSANGAPHFGARVGHSNDNTAEDAGHLRVTFHHNWWQDSLFQRKPRVRFGDVHVYNNYYAGKDGVSTDDYGVAAAFNSRLLVENNYFDNVQSPHVFFSFADGKSTLTEPTAQMVANNNTYVGVSDLEAGKLSGQGTAFTPPYAVTLEPADTRLKDFARHCTGPQ